MPIAPVAAALLLAAVVGLLVAAYFVAVTYRWIPPDPQWLPHFCRMDGATCARIVDTPDARLLGLPNSVFGVAWYALLLSASVAWIAGQPFPRAPLLAGAAAAALMSVVLTYRLLFRLRILCPLCLLAHGVNAVVLAILVLA